MTVTYASDLLSSLKTADFLKKEICIAEAQFGLRHIAPHLENLPRDAKILEVGCGSGILLGLLKERFPDLDCEGVEPFGDGFAAIQALSDHIREGGIQIHHVGYEAHHPPHLYDVIYSINVFEHLPDWRHFLDYAIKHLKPEGVCVILCPNYGFPYESHFKLPILINKTITGKVFQKAIQRREQNRNTHGLWKSLNFVKLRQVRAAAESRAFSLTVHANIIEDMIARISTDEQFKKRQSWMGILGRI
ncbi:MAG: class I SAM-dependent methyltransferase, partial [Alphaproteobacteria bacterium]|nr:class I SAM-dependent methyltransferase [Alphaproteobacteria bacterium]